VSVKGRRLYGRNGYAGKRYCCADNAHRGYDVALVRDPSSNWVSMARRRLAPLPLPGQADGKLSHADRWSERPSPTSGQTVECVARQGGHTYVRRVAGNETGRLSACQIDEFLTRPAVKTLAP